MIWTAGVTTVESRRRDLLPSTLASLRAGGWSTPRLFVDGCHDPESWRDEFGLDVTCRQPPIRAVGNWILALWELYLRAPMSDRFAVFQDDFVCYRNLRQYLERCAYPERGYWNLFQFPSNQPTALRNHGLPAPADDFIGWYPSNQNGRGAVALVFSREAVVTLLSARTLVEKPLNATRGTVNIDGAVVTAFSLAGWQEYVHNPSLTWHTGAETTMTYDSKHPRTQKQTVSFRGESFDAMSLLEEAKK